VVDVLVDNHWLTGLVVANDGIGVVLDNEGEEHCVVRLECVAAVRVGARAPMLRRIPGGQAPEPRYDSDRYDGARPMPAPQVSVTRSAV
jgi:hypothetical protein